MGIIVIIWLCFHNVILKKYDIKWFSWAHSFNRLKRDNFNKNRQIEWISSTFIGFHVKVNRRQQKMVNIIHLFDLFIQRITPTLILNYILCENQHQWITLSGKTLPLPTHTLHDEACLNNHIEQPYYPP